MFAPKLAPDLQSAILDHLGCPPGPPDLAHLEALIAAYVRLVPWESAFRIVKRAKCDQLPLCPRWPEEFWLDYLQRGGGGTCFESNYAFSALLHGLGFEGYLTINNMDKSIACHAAIIVFLHGEKWLVDVGYPLYVPISIDPNDTSKGVSPFQQYTIRPEDADRFTIERYPHPEPYTFTLIDRPVDLDKYRQITTADYGPNGHFLQRVIVHKIVDEKMWRFTSSEEPPQLTCFSEGQRTDTLIEDDVAAAVAAKFDIDEAVVRQALELIERKLAGDGDS